MFSGDSDLFCSFGPFQEYLQRERCGSARLESFAAGIELIGQKVKFTFASVCD